MAIRFRRVTSSPLQEFDAAAPDGVVIGIVGDDDSGARRLLRLAAGLEAPASGEIERSGAARLLAPGDPLDFGRARVLLADHAFALQPPFARECGAIALRGLCRGGATALVASHEDELLLRLADEIWWLDGGRIAGRGDPAEMLAGRRRRTAERLRAWGTAAGNPTLEPKMRSGDGRAEIVALETIGEDGRPTMVWRSGELAVVRLTVRFDAAVADPVAGIMIRTPIGLNVYGTNTELERLSLGPRAAGDTLVLTFAFRCELCPGEYTLTAASHDPDGVWHDWMEDAVAFTVTDSRYTAGVANLRATVNIEA